MYLPKHFEQTRPGAHRTALMRDHPLATLVVATA